MKIIFVAHGETLENTEEILLGQLVGGELSPRGKSQSQELAKELKDAKIDAAYSSDLSRAIQTANEILKYHKNLQLISTKNLRERDYGAWQGKKKDEVGWNNHMVYEDRSGFETIRNLFSRIEKFLVKIEKKHKNDTVLLVAHRNCGIAIECIVKGIPLSKISSIMFLNTGGMKIFNYESKRIKD